MSTTDFTATPIKACNKCGANDRNNSGNCRVCARATSRAWKRSNPEKIKASGQAYVAKNRDAERSRQARWYEKNKSRASASHAAWRKKNGEARRAYTTAWRASNLTKYKATMAAYLETNKVRISLTQANYRKNNRVKIRSAHIVWNRANSDRLKSYAHNRRARVRDAIGVLSPGLAKKLFALQKGKCPCCKKPLGHDFHIDHIYPLALGGSNSDDNIQLLRKSCNHQKSYVDPVVFMQRRGFLL